MCFASHLSYLLSSRIIAARSRALVLGKGIRAAPQQAATGHGSAPQRSYDDKSGAPWIGGAATTAVAAASSFSAISGLGCVPKSNVNLKTIAILPVTAIVPVAEFTDRLKAALELIGASVSLLNTASVMGKLGRHAFTRLGRLKLINWLADQEEHFRLVLYVADGGVNSPWTQRCVRQADCILLVGLGDEDPSIREYEHLLIGMKTTARKELILLHNERSCIPGSTAAWLKNRSWVHAHHHVQMQVSTPRGLITSASRKNTINDIKNHFQRYYTRALSVTGHRHEMQSPNTQTGIRSDFARIARRLLNK